MPSRWKHILLLLIVFSPALFTGRLVWKKAVDIGCWDMWENAPLLQKWHDGALTWHDLYAPQIQHRIVIPRLLIIALSHLSGGDFRWENYATFAFVLLSAVLIYRLMLKTLGDSMWCAAIAFVANLLIFSPMLYQIFFWGSSLWMVIPMPCLLVILNLLSVREGSLQTQSPRGAWILFVVTFIIAEIATHSFSHGLMFWPVVLVYILLQPSIVALKTRLVFAGIWFVAGAVTIACYFLNFYNAAHHAYTLKVGDYALESTLNLLSADDRAKFIGFFFGFLGNVFARTPFEDHPLKSAESLGVWVLIAFLIPAALIVFTKEGRKLWRLALPWLALAAYVIGVALAISKGRAVIGEHRAVTTRYIVIGLFLPVSTLALWVLVGRAFVGEWISRRLTNNAPAIFGACALTMLVMMEASQWRYGLHLTEIWINARWQAKALAMFLPHFKLKGDQLKVLDKDSKDWHCIDAIKKLRGLGLFKTPVLDSPDLKSFKREPKLSGITYSAITNASISKQELLDKSGHSFAPPRFEEPLNITGFSKLETGRTPDLILLTRGDKVIALGQPQRPPMLRIFGLDYEFANEKLVPQTDLIPWSASTSDWKTDAPTNEIECWALDVQRMSVSKFTSKLRITVGTDGLAKVEVVD